MTMNMDPLNYPSINHPEPDIIDPVTKTSIGGPASSAPGPSGPTVLESPEWWLDRLVKKLQARAIDVEAFAAFHGGDQPLAFASKEFSEAYGSRFKDHRANFMPLIVDAEKNRLVVQGFRYGDAAEPDKSAWKIWQRNQLDAESVIAHEIALVKSEAYTLVAPGPDGPVITIEDPSETIVETAPGNRRIRRAGLKVFLDDDGYLRAYLYLPDGLYKFRSANRRTGEGQSGLGWVPDPGADEPWPLENKLGVVPLVPLVNRPRRSGRGRSEIEPVMANQLAINFLRYSALIGSDVAALPQRWARNLDLEVDPATGTVRPPFKTGKHTLWAARRPTPEEAADYGDHYPETEFGQFPAADLAPFVSMIKAELSQMASISDTPFYYLFGDPGSIPPSGESRKASEAPLVTKVKWQALHFGEGWEETMRLALILDGKPGKARTDAETIWADPETRNEAANTDAVIKQHAEGLLPDEIALEELGYSPQTIARIMAIKAAEKAAGAAPAPADAAITGPPAPGSAGL